VGDSKIQANRFGMPICAGSRSAQAGSGLDPLLLSGPKIVRDYVANKIGGAGVSASVVMVLLTVAKVDAASSRVIQSAKRLKPLHFEGRSAKERLRAKHAFGDDMKKKAAKEV